MTRLHRASRLGAATFLVLAALAGCSGTHCKNEAFLGLPSPDGALIAFVFYRTCGDPAAVTTNVSIVDFTSSLRNDPGNALIVNDKQPVKVSWHSTRRLAVTGFTSPTYRVTGPLGSATVEFP